MLHKNISVDIKVTVNEKPLPNGKLGTAEVVFSGDPLDGLRLVGFSIWRKDDGGKNVTMPVRQYAMNGQMRRFNLLNPMRDGALNRLKQLILMEFASQESVKQRSPQDDEFPDLPRP
jgi:hypothetical protein